MRCECRPLLQQPAHRRGDASSGWDALVYRNPDNFKLEPLLATEWKLPDATTIEFTLRPGVKFHDGSPFTADDVVYTLNLVSDPASKVSTPANYNWIEKAERTGEFSVRVKLKRPTPAALEYFALVLPDLCPRPIGKKWERRATPRLRSAPAPTRSPRSSPAFPSTSSASRIDWAGSRRENRDQEASVRFVPDATTEMTELLAQRADWIWNLNPDQFDNVNKLPMLTAVRKESMRVGYLLLDAAGRTGADNPITKLKVRQAIWHAIDRKTIADKLVTGGKPRSGCACFPTQFGCDAEAAVLLRLRSRKAKAVACPKPVSRTVLRSSLRLMCCRSRSAAVQNYLQAVGIRAKINQMQTAALTQRRKRASCAPISGSWGSFFDQ